jgi:hypothetical protein
MPQIKQNSADKVFKTFPEFSQLTLNDRKEYEKLVRDYPPISDLSFGTLMSWWNELENISIARLNDNLVMSYWFPGYEDISGLSVIGTNKIDETICEIFDHMRSRGDEPRLVNVPEFVLENIQYPDLFTYKNLRRADEYILPVSRFYPLDRAVSFRKQRVKSFLKYIGKESVTVKFIDLNDLDITKAMMAKAGQWEKGGINNIAQAETSSLKRALVTGNMLPFEAVGIFINGELEAFCLYQLPHQDARYVILSFFKYNNRISKLLDYAVYALGKWFSDREIIYVNIDSDLGIPSLRALKLALGPVNYFRKYEIKPVSHEPRGNFK